MHSQQTTCVGRGIFQAAHRSPARDATSYGKSARQARRVAVRQLSELFLVTKAVVTMSLVWRRFPRNPKNRRPGRKASALLPTPALLGWHREHLFEVQTYSTDHGDRISVVWIGGQLVGKELYWLPFAIGTGIALDFDRDVIVLAEARGRYRHRSRADPS